MNGKFDIQSIEKPVNHDITIVFSPSKNVTSYTYQIYQNDILINQVDVNQNTNATIKLTDTGTYKITVQTNLINGVTDTVTSGEYIIDKEAPKINISAKEININKKKKKDIISCTANDNYSGNLTNKITTNLNDLTLDKVGKYNYTCIVQDEAGNIAKENAIINVTAPNTTIYIIQYTCLIVLLLLIIHILKLFKVIKLEERLDPYVIKPLKSDTITTSEKLRRIYKEFLEMFTSKLKKSVVASKYAKKLDKYISVSGIHKTGFDILSGKIIIACTFTVFAVIIKAFQFKLLGSMETLGVFVLGFFVLYSIA